MFQERWIVVFWKGANRNARTDAKASCESGVAEGH